MIMQCTVYVSRSRSEGRKPKAKNEGGGHAKHSLLLLKFMLCGAIIVVLYSSLPVDPSASTKLSGMNEY
jgi:hypothetical protein